MHGDIRRQCLDFMRKVRVKLTSVLLVLHRGCVRQRVMTSWKRMFRLRVVSFSSLHTCYPKFNGTDTCV